MNDYDRLLLTERQAYERLSVGRSTLRKLMAQGLITPVHIGRAIRFRATDLPALVERLAKAEV